MWGRVVHFWLYRNIESYSCNLRKVKIKIKSRARPFSWENGMRLVTNHTNLCFARFNFNLLKEPRPKAWFKFQPFTLTYRYIFGPAWHGSFFLLQLGKMRLTVPCRAVTCSHLQCFDAALYLQMNEKKPTWICPVCDKKAAYESLIIDG